MTLGVFANRVLPMPLPRRAPHLVERNLLVYRRGWIVIVSGFLEPLLYLLGIGYGIGSLVGTVPVGSGRVSYAVFVAPALMASAAMNGAIFDSTYNLFYKLKYARTYDAILATPVGPADVALGEVAWALIRGSAYAIGFVVVMAVLGLATSPLAVLAIPGAMLIGFAFAALGCAATTFLHRWQDFDIVFMVVLTLFLFSATFFPVSAYPAPLQLVVQLTPLYHGAGLLRGLTTGALGPGMLVDVAYLLAIGAVGVLVTARRLDSLLLK